MKLTRLALLATTLTSATQVWANTPNVTLPLAVPPAPGLVWSGTGLALLPYWGGGGTGITSGAVNGSGHLILTLATGATVDSGLISPASPAGTGMTSTSLSGGNNHLIVALANGSTIDAGALTYAPASTTTFAGNGSPPGTPGFVVTDLSNGVASYVSATQATQLLAGSLIQTIPSPPAIALGAPTYNAAPYTITPPATGSTPFIYQVNYRVSGTSTWLPAGASSTGLTGTITGLTGSNVYDVEVTAANGGGTATSLVTALSTPAAPPPAVLNSAVLASDGQTLTFTFSKAVTLISGDFAFTVNGTAASATNTDGATSQASHVFTLASSALTGQAVTYSASPVGAASPPLSTVASNATVTNNSSVTTPSSYSFAGPAGPVTNLTAVSGSSVADLTLDGSGHLLIPTRANGNGAFPGVQADGTVTVTASSLGSLAVLARVNGSTYYQASFNLAAGAAVLYSTVNNVQTQLGNNPNAYVPNGAAGTVGLKVQGSTITVLYNGAALITVTDSSITAAGQVGIGEIGPISNGVGTSVTSVAVSHS